MQNNQTNNKSNLGFKTSISLPFPNILTEQTTSDKSDVSGMVDNLHSSKMSLIETDEKIKHDDKVKSSDKKKLPKSEYKKLLKEHNVKSLDFLKRLKSFNTNEDKVNLITSETDLLEYLTDNILRGIVINSDLIVIESLLRRYITKPEYIASQIFMILYPSFKSVFSFLNVFTDKTDLVLKYSCRFFKIPHESKDILADYILSSNYTVDIKLKFLLKLRNSKFNEFLSTIDLNSIGKIINITDIPLQLKDDEYKKLCELPCIDTLIPKEKFDDFLVILSKQANLTIINYLKSISVITEDAVSKISSLKKVKVEEKDEKKKVITESDITESDIILGNITLKSSVFDKKISDEFLVDLFTSKCRDSKLVASSISKWNYNNNVNLYPSQRNLGNIFLNNSEDVCIETFTNKAFSKYTVDLKKLIALAYSRNHFKLCMKILKKNIPLKDLTDAVYEYINFDSISKADKIKLLTL